MAESIPIALTLLGAGTEAGGSILSGNSQAGELRTQAAQLEANALADRATSQRRASEERRQARLTASRTLAVAASSGAGADDPTIMNLMADMEGEGEYRALAALYEGETAARAQEEQAKANRRAASRAKTAAAVKASSSILGAGLSLFDRFGGD